MVTIFVVIFLFVSVPEHQRDSHLEESLCVPDPNPLPVRFHTKMSSVVAIDSIDNDDLTKRILNLINVNDWPDECGKCGHPRVLHRELHRVSACSEPRESRDEFHRIWTEYWTRVKPILKFKETAKKDSEQEILLQGLENLVKKISSQNAEQLRL